MNKNQKKALCAELRKSHLILQLGASFNLVFVLAIVGLVGYFLYSDFRLAPDQLEKLSKNTNATILFVSARFFVVVFASIVCALLIGVIRYNVLLSNFWLSRAFALELMPEEDALSANELVTLLSPEKIEFLSSRNSTLSEMTDLLKQLKGVSKNNGEV